MNLMGNTEHHKRTPAEEGLVRIKVNSVIEFMGVMLIGLLCWIGQGIRTDVESLKGQVTSIQQKLAIVDINTKRIDRMEDRMK